MGVRESQVRGRLPTYPLVTFTYPACSSAEACLERVESEISTASRTAANSALSVEASAATMLKRVGAWMISSSWWRAWAVLIGRSSRGASRR